MPRTIEQQVESFSKRLFVADPELKAFLLTVLREGLYREAPNDTNMDSWLWFRCLYATAIYFGTPHNLVSTADHLTSEDPRSFGERLSKQGVQQKIHKTLDILYTRYHGSSQQREKHPFKINKLSGKNHSIARFIATHSHLTDPELRAALNEKFTPNYSDVQKLNELLPRYNVHFPKKLSANQLKENLSDIFTTSQDTQHLLEAFAQLTTHHLKDEREKPIAQRLVISLNDVAKLAGIANLNSAKYPEINELLQSNGVVVGHVKFFVKTTDRQYQYHLVSQSMLRAAVAIIEEQIEDKAAYESRFAELVAGPPNREAPNLTEFTNEYRHFGHIFGILSLPHKRITEQFLTKLIDEQCPAPIFCRQFPKRQEFKYHLEDEAALVEYVRRRYVEVYS